MKNLNKKKIVHIMGTGTIGEPLIVLLARTKHELGIDEITFSKHTARTEDKPMLYNLMMQKGARLCVEKDKFNDFFKMGLEPEFNLDEALERASVVIDCTPAGNENKKTYYKKYQDKTLGFIAQGGEKDFGKPYAFSITDSSLSKTDKYLWVVSCNTHNISTIVWTIALDFGNKDASNLVLGDFTLFRRATDMNQPSSEFIPAPEVGKHSSNAYGTHQAEDAKNLFKQTLGMDLNLFSSAAKANSQYMHIMRFHLQLKENITKNEVIRRITKNSLIATTNKKSAAHVFSFGRDQGHYGRILNQTVIQIDTIEVVNKNRVVGWCFTPQDGNSLLSSTAATLWFLYPNDYLEKMSYFKRPPFIHREV